MSEVQNIISTFNHYSSWLSTLEEMDESLWFKPIAEGKWSVSEIIAHIMNWDHHLLAEILPSVPNETGMEFPDFDTYNNKASNYAKSGISPSKLLIEAKDKRKLLIKELNKLPTAKLTQPLPANNVTHCPHTGTPYSLIYIVKKFTDHDHHHKKQMIQFLKKNNLD
ncbi:hypothetical protein CON64_17930 [Bacillus pseudomycoides]|nr:hypothetical protein CON64_17930 [Bacillus pseudomycoides]